MATLVAAMTTIVVDVVVVAVVIQQECGSLVCSTNIAKNLPLTQESFCARPAGQVQANKLATRDGEIFSRKSIGNGRRHSPSLCSNPNFTLLTVTRGGQ